MKLITKRIAKYYKYLILIKYYAKKLSFSKNYNKPVIIVCFDGNFSHGGLVDRLKGIISFYQISKILDYDFKVFFKHPFDLRDFLNPNLIDWSINEKDLKYSPFSFKILYLMNDFKTNPLHIFAKSKAKTFFVYSNVDYLPTLFPDKKEEDIKTIWRNNYKELFKISDYLKEKLKLLPEDFRLAFHTRFTTLIGDFSDSTKLVLSENEKMILIQKVIKSIDEAASQYPDKIKYVFSDSTFFLQYIKTHTNYKTLDGAPKHLENNNSDIDYHSKTFLDFYFLAESDMIFSVKIDEMYFSSFSKYAAIVGNKDFKRIMN